MVYLSMIELNRNTFFISLKYAAQGDTMIKDTNIVIGLDSKQKPITLHHELWQTALAVKGLPTFGSTINATC